MKGSRSFCSHYQAMSEHKECRAGVNYQTLKGIPFDKRPCFCINGKPNGGGCDKAEYPTAEEIAERDAMIKRQMEGTGKAREAIVKACGGPWKRGTDGWSGAIDCPVCDSKGTLRFSRAGHNGHIHASCTTADCVSWME